MDTRRAMPPRRKGWIKVAKADIAFINAHAGASSSATAVWLSMLTLANDRRSTHFNVPIRLIARIAGVCYRTANRQLFFLEKAGFIKVRRRRGGRWRPPRESSHYTLLRGTEAVPEVPTMEQLYGTPSARSRRRRSRR